MSRKSMWLEMRDQKKLFIHTWTDVKQPKGIVQIVHGMAEHGARYDDFACFLNEQGYIVFADDHRGHGETSGYAAQGKLDRECFETIVDDEIEISRYLIKEYQLPLFLIGHSFGSLVSQRYIIKESSLPNKVVLVGSGSASVAETKALQWFSSIAMKFKGETGHSPFIEKLAIGSFNRRIKHPQSEFDWVSADSEVVGKYIADQFCGAPFSTGYYYSLAKGLSKMYQANVLKGIRQDLPILIVSGVEDPVGKYTKGVKRLSEKYVAAGVQSVELKLYDKMRHEILNEKEHQLVYADIATFL